MATYLLQNSHAPEECEAVTRDGRDAPASRGREVSWTCTAGVHGGYCIGEASDPKHCW